MASTSNTEHRSKMDLGVRCRLGNQPSHKGHGPEINASSPDSSSSARGGTPPISLLDWLPVFGDAPISPVDQAEADQLGNSLRWHWSAPKLPLPGAQVTRRAEWRYFTLEQGRAPLATARLAAVLTITGLVGFLMSRSMIHVTDQRRDLDGTVRTSRSPTHDRLATAKELMRD